MVILIKFYSTCARLPIEENAANVISSLVFENMVIEKSQNKSYFFLGSTGATEEKLSTNCERPFWGKENCKSHHILSKKRSHVPIFRQCVTIAHELSRIPPYTLLL
jgi:hypothetical protein